MNKQKNGKTSKNAPNDENWKLLKFLVDRIDAKKNTKTNSKRPQSATSPKQPKDKKPNRHKQIPITGNLLKRRKKPATVHRRKKISVTNMRTSFSNDALHARSHIKTKSQALYTSAINKYDVNSPTRVSKAGAPPTTFRLYGDKSKTPRAGQMSPARNSKKMTPKTPSLSIEHQKSHSTHLPHKYTHRLSQNNDEPPSSSSSTTPSQTTEIEANPSNISAATTTTASTATVKFKFPENVNGDRTAQDTKTDTQDDDPLSDPVQSLVTFVRRVTEKISEAEAKQVSDQETIRKVYDKYVEFYHRLPVNPDHLRKFSHKFKDVNITYAAAKQYLDNVKAIESVTSPRSIMSDEPPLQQLRTSHGRQSVSTPMLPGMEKSESNDSDMAHPHGKMLKIKLDPEEDLNTDNDRENLYAFYKLTDLELLRRIKKKIDSAYNECKANDDAAATIMNIWEREYSELEKRLHKQFLTPMHKRKLQSSLSFNHHQLKRDTTYKSLKQMSEATDIDDQEHDAAVHLLNTYFPDDDEEDIHDEVNGNHLMLSPPYHPQHSSNVVPPHEFNQYAETIKPQEQHIRSVTVDNHKSHNNPALYRRSTTRSMRQSEALSLYDSMVMKARETKILNKKSPRKYKGASAGFLTKAKSLPTRDAHSPRQATLGTIPSQDSGVAADEDEGDEEGDGKLLNMIQDIHGVYHQPFKLDDDEMNLRNEITPEPPLFDAAFRQLTTTTDPLSEYENMYNDEVVLSDNDTTINVADALHIESIALNPSTAHSAKSTLTIIPGNLLSIMDKYGDSMESWDFDIFEFMDDPALCGKGLVLCTFYVFRKVGLLDATGVAQANLWRFLENVERGYLNNPYHNRYHAVDVLLSTHYMFQSSLFMKHMTMWDRFGAYIAAVCHDLGHMGLNNAWYINTAGNLALLYGDDSVLENYHIAETFRILNDSKNNWMLSFPSSVRRYLATVIRRTILATDLKVHGTKMIQLQHMVDTFKNIMNKKQATGQTLNQHEFIANNITLWRCESIANYASLDNIMLDNFPLFIDRQNADWIPDVLVKDLDINAHDDSDDNDENEPHKPRVLDVDDERIFLLEITIHACDVANPCKPIYIAKEWATRYLKEAFNQGDMERNIGIPVSAGMDRFTSKLPTSQIGFITFIVKRLFLLYSELINVADHCVEIMLQNEQFWIQEKKKMNKSNKMKSNLGTINE